MKKYLIVVAYDGTNYSGYQKQPKSTTIQGEIEKVLKKINNNKKVDITASGRTDKGVHAINQNIHFELEVSITCEKLRMALNSYLPNDIHVKSVERIEDDFHARYNVKYKEYLYKINIGDYNPNERNNVYQYNKTLNILEMKKALKYLEGEHDFTSFACQDEVKEDCVRRIVKTKLVKEKDIITITFLGTGFLKYQVRNMMGTLLDIGSNKLKSKDMIKIIENKSRKQASRTANPEGLYLSRVIY